MLPEHQNAKGLVTPSPSSVESREGDKLGESSHQFDIHMESRLIEALTAIHNPQTPSHIRSAANQLIEEFQSEYEAPIPIAWGLATAKDASPVFRHFGIHATSIISQRCWSSWSMADQSALKDQALSLLVETTPQDPPFLKEKMAALVASIAIRDWPERWPSLLPSLIDLASIGVVQHELSMLTMIRLLEDALGPNSTLSEGHRRVCLQSMIQSLDTVFPFLTHTLAEQFQAFIAGSSSALVLVKAALSAIRSMVDWIPLSLVLGADDFVGVFCRLLRVPDLKAEAALALLALTSRKAKGEDRLLLAGLLAHVDTITEAMREGQTGDFDEDYAFLKAMTEVLVNVAMNADIMQDKRRRDAYSQLLAVIGRVAEHPSLMIFDLTHRVWESLLRNPEMCRTECVAGIVQPLLHTAADKLLKVGDPNRDNHPSCAFARLDFGDDSHEFWHTFSVYRGRTLELCRALSSLVPSIAMRLGAERLHAVLSGPVDVGDESQHGQPPGCCSSHSPSHLLLEGAVCFFECVIDGIPRDILAGRPGDVPLSVKHRTPRATGVYNRTTPDLLKADAAEVNRLGLATLQMLLDHQTTDTLLLLRLLHCLQCFGPFVKYRAPNALLATLSHVFPFVTWRHPSELQDTLAAGPNTADVEVGRVWRNTIAVRRKACATVISIIREAKTELLPHFEELCGQVRTMLTAQPAVLTDGERAPLYEALIEAGNALPSREQQAAFLNVLLQGPCDEWASVDTIVRDPESLLRHGGIGGVDPFPQAPSVTRLNWLVGIWHIAIRTCVPVNPEAAGPNPLFALFESRVLPNLFALINTLHAIFEPRLISELPQEWIGIVQMSEIERRQFLGRMVDEDDEIGHQDDRVRLLSRLLNSLRQNSYGCVAHLCRNAPEMYRHHRVTSAIASLVFSHIDCMASHHIRLLVKNVASVLVSRCPPDLIVPIVSPLLPGLCALIVDRVQSIWERLKGVGYVGREESKDEIVEEKVARDLGRSLFGLLIALVPDEQRQSPLDDLPSPALVGSRAAVLKQPDLVLAMLRTAAAGMTWPDTLCCRRAVQLCNRSTPTLLAEGDRQLHEILGNDMLMAALQALTQRENKEAHADLVLTIRELYCLTANAAPDIPRGVFLRLPGVNEQRLAALESELAACAGSEKRQRQVFRSFLGNIIGSEGGRFPPPAPTGSPVGLGAAVNARLMRQPWSPSPADLFGALDEEDF